MSRPIAPITGAKACPDSAFVPVKDGAERASPYRRRPRGAQLQRRARPRLIFVAMRNFRFLLATILLFFFPACANAQLQRNDSERQLFEALNRERIAKGLSALQWDNALFKAARRHALLMLNLHRLEPPLPRQSGPPRRLPQP